MTFISFKALFLDTKVFGAALEFLLDSFAILPSVL